MKPISSDVYWYRNVPVTLDPLYENIPVDAVIVGGGIAGLSCAQALHKSGFSVAVVERDFCGGGASGKSAGFVLSDTEVELGALLNRFGPKKARKIWDFSIPGIEKMRANIKEYDFSCDYQEQDALFAAINTYGRHDVENEHKTYQRLKFESTLYTSQEMKDILGSTRFTEAIGSPGSFSINPFAYCRSLVDVLLQEGVRIFENTPVTKVRADGVDTPSGIVTAKYVLVCADRFIPELGALKNEIYHIQTFLGITKPLSAQDFKKVFPTIPVMVWDTELVYTYFRSTSDNRIVIGGGDMLHTYAPHISKHTEHFAHKLQKYLDETFHEIPFEFETVWPGMLGVSKDLLPVMGPDSEHSTIWYAGAATGLAWATALGLYAAQHITENRNDYDELFAWNRPYKMDGIKKFLPVPATFALCNSAAEFGE